MIVQKVKMQKEIDLFVKMENHFTKCIQGCTFV